MNPVIYILLSILFSNTLIPSFYGLAPTKRVAVRLKILNVDAVHMGRSVFVLLNFFTLQPGKFYVRDTVPNLKAENVTIYWMKRDIPDFSGSYIRVWSDCEIMISRGKLKKIRGELHPPCISNKATWN
jgi:hypothetical protein